MGSITKKYICANCGNEFESGRGCKTRTPKYCSRNCSGRFEKGLIPWNKGKPMWDTRPHPKGTLGMKFEGRKASDETRKKLSEAHKKIKQITRFMSGGMHWNWKGGKSGERERVKQSSEYKNWRRKVFERDNFTCQSCFIRGGNLQAHHIKPYATYPEARFLVDNGLTLCKDCHKKTESYGVKCKNQIGKT